MAKFPIPITKVHKDKRKKTRQKSKVDLKKQVDEERKSLQNNSWSDS